MPEYETRIICWSASSNTSFHGKGDWHPADAPDPDTAQREAEDYGLELALDGSGFEWYVEVRKVGEEV